MTRSTRKSGAVTALAIAAAFAASLASTPQARATAIFTEGNNPQANEENVLFQNPQTGTTITGTTNLSNTSVQFDSTQTLATGGVGQAFLEPVSPDTVITGTVTFSIPGLAFKDYIFNPTVTGPDADGGAATIVAVTNDGTFAQNITLSNGNNFWTITTTPDEFLLSVSLELAAGTNYATYRQPRVSGICTPGEIGCTLVPIQAPEPTTLAILGGALIGFGLLRRRKKA
ncbi:MAG: PEP-CTERM sorting domain-containing protein [Alphaproteobacteria bacterium]